MKKELIKELKEKREKSHITPCTFQNSGITLVALIITIVLNCSFLAMVVNK